MINVIPEIKSILIGDSTLVSLLGGQRVYYQAAPVVNHPYITFFEITNISALHADDQEKVSEIHIQVDIWNKNEPSTIALQVDSTLDSNGYQRTGTMDSYDPETKVFHRGLRYCIAKEN